MYRVAIHICTVYLMRCIAEQTHIVSVFSHDVTFMFTLNITVAAFPYKQTAGFLINFFITILYHYEEITTLELFKLSNVMS